MVADLEEVLAIEASRSRPGHRRGDERAAHAARRRARGGCPGACATRRAGSPSLALVARDRGDRARGRRSAHAPRHRRAAGHRLAARACEAGRRSARPRRTTTTRSAPGPENRDQVDNVVDSDPNTTWSTEQYYDGTLQEARRRRLGHVPRRRPGRARQGDRDPDAHARLRGADLCRQPHRPGAALRQLHAADRARLAGTGRTSALRARRRTHPADAWRARLPLLPDVDHDAAARTCSRRRSPTSRCSGSRPAAAVGRRAGASWRSSASRQRRSTSSG